LHETPVAEAPARSGSARLLYPLIGDISGAFGDIGTLVPLAVALISVNGLAPFAVLGLAGGAYLAAGAWFGGPMPVQPLKAASAIAIARGLPAPVVSATAVWMGGILLVLAVSGAAARLDVLFPLPIVRGVQLGVGLLLLRSAWGMLSPSILDVLLALACLAFLIILRSRVPTALILAGIGFAWAGLHWRGAVHWSLPMLVPRVPTAGEMAVALTVLTIPQLPLTLGNSVVATCDAAAQYFPDAAKRVTPRRICTSLAVANLTAGWLGGMPMCHGSGGLTAHYKFGARTWRSNLVIGLALICTAAALGGDAVPLFRAFPKPILSAMLAYVGIQHSLLARALPDRSAVLTALAVGATGAVTGNLLIGMIAGTAVHWLGIAARRAR